MSEDVKLRDVSVVINNDSEGGASMNRGSKILKGALQKYFMLYNVPLQSLMEEMELNGKILREQVNLDFTDLCTT